MDEMHSWFSLKLEDFTVEDAIKTYEMGLACICADGKLKHLSKE